MKLVYGVGINDADYEVSKYKQNTVLWVCPIYEDWKGMLRRCYDEDYHKTNSTYTDCIVCTDWLTFSNFRKWVLEGQPNKDWQRSQLDKDILNIGNKVYSPETCVYVQCTVNNFIINNSARRGEYLLGVGYQLGSKFKPYRVRCRNPFTKTMDSVGSFANELEAHKAWQERKHLYACQLADLQQDTRVAKALRERYAPDKDWSKV